MAVIAKKNYFGDKRSEFYELITADVKIIVLIKLRSHVNSEN